MLIMSPSPIARLAGFEALDRLREVSLQTLGVDVVLAQRPYEIRARVLHELQQKMFDVDVVIRQRAGHPVRVVERPAADRIELLHELPQQTSCGLASTDLTLNIQRAHRSRRGE